MKSIKFFTFAVLFMLANSAISDEVWIQDVKMLKKGDSWHFNVTLKHADTGWEHYADAWRVVLKDGTVLGTRTLYHPHVDEQPFTRGLSGVKIPKETREVFVEAHDKVHGWSKQRYKMKMP